MSRRRTSAVLVIGLLLVSCSSDASKGPGTAAPPTSAAGSTTSVVIGSDGSSSIVTGPAPTAAAGSAATCSSDCGGERTEATADPNGPPGAYAVAILSPKLSSAVDLEVHAQSGADPQPASIDHVRSVLGAVSQKSVQVRQGAEISGAARSWSADDLRAAADAGGATPATTTAVIHLLFVHGTFGGDQSVLGVAVRGDTAAVFVDQVASSSTPLVGSAGIESAVVTHEVGHLLGLVDLVLHSGRQDPDHPGHSRNQKSVMYWAVESNLVADLLGSGPPKDFDGDDLADLSTIRNG